MILIKTTLRDDIQVLRGIAVLLVIFSHIQMPLFEAGFIGVDIFFVISGYLITQLLVREFDQYNQIEILAFYARRLKRLFPALIFMLLISSLVMLITLAPSEQNGQIDALQMAGIWVSNLFFATGDVDYFEPASNKNVFLHTWSLGVEEQFYLIWPLLLIMVLKRHSIQMLRLVFIATIIISFTACLYLTYQNPMQAFYQMPCRAWQFSIGGLLAISPDLFNQKLVGKKYKLKPDHLFIGGIILLIVALLVIKEDTYFPGIAAILPTLAAAFLIAGGKQGQSSHLRFIPISPIKYIGDISYSLYLWHWPCLIIGTMLMMQPATLKEKLLLMILATMLATFSYYFIEQPIRHAANKKFKKHVIPVSLIICALFIIVTEKWKTNIAVWRKVPDQIIAKQAKFDQPLFARKGCDLWYFSAQLKSCDFGSADAEKTMVLLGDSIAGQWFPLFEKVLLQQDLNNWNIKVLTKSSCPIVEEPFFYKRIKSEYTVCHEWREAALEWIAENNPDMVVIGNTSYRFAEAQWIKGTKKVLEKIESSSKHILLITPSYQLPFHGPRCMERRHWQSRFFTAFGECEAVQVQPRQDKIKEWLERSSAAFNNVHVIDFNPVICPDKVCKASADDLITFRDPVHLTASFVRTLSAPLSRLLRELILE